MGGEGEALVLAFYHRGLRLRGPLGACPARGSAAGSRLGAVPPAVPGVAAGARRSFPAVAPPRRRLAALLCPAGLRLGLSRRGAPGAAGAAGPRSFLGGRAVGLLRPRAGPPHFAIGCALRTPERLDNIY